MRTSFRFNSIGQTSTGTGQGVMRQPMADGGDKILMAGADSPPY